MKKSRFTAPGRQLLASHMFAMLAAAPLSAPLFALAQTQPNAGTLFDNNRQQLSPTENNAAPSSAAPHSVRIEKDLDTADENANLNSGQAGGDVKIKVTHFTLSGNRSLPDAALQKELQELVGQELDFAGLRQAAAKITALYRAQGYLVARAYLPKQEIQDGVVTIGVREGVIGKVIAEPDANVRLSPGIVTRYLDELHPGDVIREHDLENTLLRLSDIAGVNVKAVLRPSVEPGAADIIVKISETTAITARVSIDNYGNYYTGSNRLSVNLGLNDALGLGETFSVTTQNSFEGLRIFGLGYLQPIAGTPFSFGANTAELQYNVGKNLKDAQAFGEARIFTIFGNAALYRSRRANVNLGVSGERRYFEDTTAGTSVSKIATFGGLSLSGDWRDDLFGHPASSFWSARWGAGSLEKLTPNDVALDAITAKAAGQYEKTNLAFSRLQQIGGGFSVFGAAKAQYASTNLDASEKISLGGPDGVRAYPVGEAAGDEGILGRLELRKTLGVVGNSIIEAALFADAGRVTINKNPWDSSVNSATRYGYGVGVNVYNKDLVFNLGYAFSPGVAPTSETRNARYLWLSVSGAPQSFGGLGSDTENKGEDFKEPETAFVLYGSLGLIPEYVSRTGATAAAPADQSKMATPNGRNQSGFWRVRDNISYIGAHGGLPIADQWKFLWQLEFGLSVDYNNPSAQSVPDSTHTQELRNTAVALNHPQAGTLMYGNWDMPLKESTNDYDPFDSTTSAAQYNIIGSPGFSTSITKDVGPAGTADTANNDDAAFNRRQAGMFAYWTPKFAGFQGKLAYSDNSLKAAPDVDTGYLWGGSLAYVHGGFSAVVAGEQHINYFGIASIGRDARGVGSSTHVTAGTSSNDFSVRYGIAYDFGDTKISAIFDQLAYSEAGVVNTSVTSTDVSSYRRNAYLLGATHKIGAWVLRGSHARAFAGDCSMISGNNVQCSTDGMGATSDAVGFVYNWSKQLKLFGQYVLLRNQALANYNLGVSGVFGATGFSPGVGTTIRAIGVGVNYTF